MGGGTWGDKRRGHDRYKCVRLDGWIRGDNRVKKDFSLSADPMTQKGSYGGKPRSGKYGLDLQTYLGFENSSRLGAHDNSLSKGRWGADHEGKD